MPFYADLHVHSKYSRATSRDCDLEHLATWARQKGIAVVGTGDFTHPAWFAELRDKLVPAEPGLFRLRPEIEREIDRRLPPTCPGPTRFLLSVEISTIYKKGEKTRKVHHLIYAPDFTVAGRFRDQLGRIGNIASDGRPILGLDSRHLLEITLESGPGAYLIPAHVWTPWFAVLGSQSGFDTVEACYGDLSSHIFAVETGLSSDPPMNWRVSQLDRFTLVSNSDAHSPPMLGREASVFDVDFDYFALRRALETGQGYGGTVEFFPEEGKYHLDGHRACGVCLEPDETRRQGGLCPACGKPVTVGVMHRVEVLADRPVDHRPESPTPFRSLVPLPEILAELKGVGARSKSVAQGAAHLVTRLGPELTILEQLPLEDLRRAGDPRIGEAIARLRAGQVHCQAGYDGEYGVIRLFAPGELAARAMVPTLFDLTPAAAPAEEAGTPTAPEEAANSGAGAEEAGTSGAYAEEAGAPEEEAGTAPGLLARLDPEQRSAAEIPHGALLIVAGPGTGKTRTLTHRIAWLIEAHGVAPETCLALTFTHRAADEMRERLRALVPDVAGRILVTTFHGLGLHLLRELHLEAGLERDFRVAGEMECRELVAQLFDLSPRRARRLVADFSRLHRQRAALDPADDSGDDVAELLEPYEAALQERGWVDFDTLLTRPLAVFAARPDLLSRYRERFRFLSIDEYQDIDALQYRLVRALAPEGSNVCAIGDPDQSIYRFRGADVGFFLRFLEDYPEARRVELTRNYRSSRTIVAAALQAITPVSLVAGRRLVAMRTGTPPPIGVHAAATPEAEAEAVVHTLEKLLGGTSYFSVDSGRVGPGDPCVADLSFNDVAVLYRTAAQAEPIVVALDRAGIPYQKRSHARLGDHPGVQALLQELQAKPVDVPLVEGLDAATARLSAGDTAEAAQVLAAQQLLRPLAGRCGDDLARFQSEVALGAEVDLWDPRAERVSLLTLHAAKGLEFPVVFLVGCEDGLLPLRFGASDDETGEARDAEALAEERRLFFVGLTRAASRLVLSYARKRPWRGQVRETSPSPFLADLAEDLLERGEGDGPKRRRPREDEPRQLRLL